VPHSLHQGVEVNMMKPQGSPAAEPIGEYPEEIHKEMRHSQMGNEIAEHEMSGIVRSNFKWCHLQVRDTLRTEMNLMAVEHCRTFDYCD
jgi:hypothetical protein